MVRAFLAGGDALKFTQVTFFLRHLRRDKNKLAKLRDAIAPDLKLSPTHSLTGVGARGCYRILKSQL